MFWKKIKSGIETLNDFFPLANYLSLNPTALEIAPDAIRLIKLKKTKKRLTPIFHKEIKLKNSFELTDEDVTSEHIVDVIDNLKKLKKEFRLKYVVSSLPEQKAYIYKTLLPYAAITDIVSAIRYSMEENVPLSVNDVNFDYYVLGVNEKYIETVVGVFPKSVVKTYTEILEKAELYPISFLSESLAVSESLIDKENKKPYLVIRMMKDRVNTLIIERGVVQYATNIFVNCQNIFDSLESEDAKNLIKELNRVLIYWFTDSSNGVNKIKIQDGFLVGLGSFKEGLLDFLENGLKIDLEIGNVWSNCFSTEDYVPEMSKNESIEYSVPIGLAIRSIRYK